jgi:hypothetical protein
LFSGCGSKGDGKATQTTERSATVEFWLPDPGEAKRAALIENGGVVGVIEMSQSTTLITDGAVSSEDKGDKIVVSIKYPPNWAPGRDCAVERASGGGWVCKNIDCSESCLPRTRDGYFYCVCGRS